MMTSPFLGCEIKCHQGVVGALRVRLLALASDLNFGDGLLPVTTTLGSPEPPWETGRETIRDGFLQLADLAAEYNVVVAAEAHAGATFDTLEKAAWLMNQTRHEHLKLNFDISHFVAQGIDLHHSGAHAPGPQDA